MRVPFADTSTCPVPAGASDEDISMLADIMPTGYEVGVLNGHVQPGDVVAIVGAHPSMDQRPLPGGQHQDQLRDPTGPKSLVTCRRSLKPIMLEMNPDRGRAGPLSRPSAPIVSHALLCPLRFADAVDTSQR